MLRCGMYFMAVTQCLPFGCRFVLGQYGLLWALNHSEDISHLVILGTPLGLNTPLRPDLAPYKNPIPFLRPKMDSKFAGDLFNAAGLAYVISYDDAQVRLQGCSSLTWLAIDASAVNALSDSQTQPCLATYIPCETQIVHFLPHYAPPGVRGAGCPGGYSTSCDSQFAEKRMQPVISVPQRL
jgi:hypothetical protein